MYHKSKKSKQVKIRTNIKAAKKPTLKFTNKNK